MTYSVLELLIFSWLALVGICCLDFISHYTEEILYVSKKFKNNFNKNSNHEIKANEIYIFTCLTFDVEVVWISTGYKETFMLLHSNDFFLSTRHFGDTHRVMYKKSNSFVCIIYISGQLPVFLNNSVKICRLNLKIGMLYHMNISSRNTVF